MAFLGELYYIHFEARKCRPKPSKNGWLEGIVFLQENYAFLCLKMDLKTIF